MEALRRGKRRRGDWTQASNAAGRAVQGVPAAMSVGIGREVSRSGNGEGGTRTPAGALALARSSSACSPLDEPSEMPTQPAASIVDASGTAADDIFELSLSEDSDGEAQTCGNSFTTDKTNASSLEAVAPPTVAEAAAFVAAAVAASPRAPQKRNKAVDAAVATTGSSRDAASRLTTLLEKRPRLKVMKTTKNKLSARELAGLSDDDDEDGKGKRAAGKAVGDEIQQRREARFQAAWQPVAPTRAMHARQARSPNSPMPLHIDLT